MKKDLEPRSVLWRVAGGGMMDKKEYRTEKWFVMGAGSGMIFEEGLVINRLLVIANWLSNLIEERFEILL